jgi:hypothetical protein
MKRQVMNTILGKIGITKKIAKEMMILNSMHHLSTLVAVSAHNFDNLAAKVEKTHLKIWSKNKMSHTLTDQIKNCWSGPDYS